MGIPAYTKRLLLNNTSACNAPSRIDHLFLDFNGMIHPSSHKVINAIHESSGRMPSRKEITRQIVDQILSDMESLISDLGPLKTLYIAIDGVAPFAKMYQQRLRRFAACESPTRHIFDSNAITPGTEFMKILSRNLAQRLVEMMERGVPYKIILNDWTSPGEGEHKIMDYIRTHDLSNDNSVLFGLDADLVMLTLAIMNMHSAHGTGHLYIGRHEQDPRLIDQFGPLNYIDMERIRQVVIHDFAAQTNTSASLNRIVLDYIFLSFLGGNDFVPTTPCAMIGCGGLDRLLSKYWEYMKSGAEPLTRWSLNQKYHVPNWPSVIIFLNTHVTPFEEEWARSNIQKIAARRTRELPFSDPVNFLDPSDWYYRYNQVFEMDDAVCERYFQSLEWVLLYYTTGCNVPDFRQMYGSIHAPSVRHMVSYLAKVPRSHVEWTGKPPCTPEQQLYCVLPSTSAHLVKDAKCRMLMTQFKSPIAHLMKNPPTWYTGYCTALWHRRVAFPAFTFDQMLCVREEYMKS